MKDPAIASILSDVIPAQLFSRGSLAALVAGLLCVSLPVAISRAQSANPDADGAEVLTRGPVHEAFAGMVSYNPEPGIVVATPPPEPIEEIPPTERPEGDDVTWIPGYWGWDDERNDYLWISGTWRALPPGREWITGYWRDTGHGHQWISGYWSDAAERETTYLPPPPTTLEIGANLAAPSLDYGWTPGCWVWFEGRYAWRAGYWARGRADWVWVPAYYVWTPRGVIFVEGFWDYPVERRGMLFAPVYYRSHMYARRGYSYSPLIAINLSIFTDHLFLRPSYHHYYFGDYYGSRYDQGGFYASFSFQSSRHGYDPFYTYSRWQHREDREWEHRFQASYEYRRENEIARPPRTWAAQLTINARPVAAGQTRILMAAPIDQLASRKDHPVRLQPVAREEVQKLNQRGREVQQSREQRSTVEAKAVVTTGQQTGRSVEPNRVPLPKSPIAAKPVGRMGKDQLPPAVQRAPKPDLKAQPKAETPGRQPSVDQRKSPSDPRKAEPGRKSPSGRGTTVPGEPKAPPAPEPRANPAAVRAQQEAQGKEAQIKAQQEAEQRAKEAGVKARAATKAQDDAEKRAKEATVKARQEADQQAGAAAGKARGEAQQKAKETATKVQQQAEQRAQNAELKAQAAAKTQQAAEEHANAAARAQSEAQQKVKESTLKAHQQTDPRARDAAVKAPVAPKAKPSGEHPAKKKPAEDEDSDAKKEKGRPPG